MTWCAPNPIVERGEDVNLGEVEKEDLMMRGNHNSLKTVTLALAGLLVAATLASHSVIVASAGERVQIAQTALNKSSDKWHVADPIQVDLDVDTAYVRLKREFNFSTLDQRIANTPAIGGVDRDARVLTLYSAGFAYDSEPGVYYLMRDRNSETANRIVQIEVSKDNDGARVDFAFATAKLPSVSHYRDQLRQRILSSLGA